MGQVRAERRLAAILAADVVGYSRLMAADETGTHGRLKALRTDLVEPVVGEHHGRIVKLMGDGVLAEFASAVDAVECGVVIQTRVAASQAEVPEDQRIVFRIGINIGDIISEADDIYGDGVNVAARLETLAEPGSICVSRNVYNQVKGKVGFGFQPLGEHEVKNIPEPVTVYRVLGEAGPMAAAVGARHAAPSRWRWVALAAAALVIIAGGGASWWYAGRFGSTDAPGAETDDEGGEPALPLPDRPSIAVLPFTNMTGDPEQEYFAGGMTEDLITDLSKVSGLFVIARNSSSRYEGAPVDPRSVGRELGVRYLLEGSVRRADDQVRINAQLIDTSTSGHVWAERYDGRLDDVFSLQDEITRKIVAVLAVQLTSGEEQQVALRETESIAAYDTFLKGWDHYLRQTPESFREAIAHFEEAIELDPNYSRAHAALAATYWQIYNRYWHAKLGLGRMHDVRLKAEESLEKAKRMPTALSHQVATAMLSQRGLHTEAVAEGGRAIAMDPNDPDSYVALAGALTLAGNPDEALKLVRQAMRLNPHFPPYYLYQLGIAQFGTGDFEGAAESLERATSHNAEDRWSYRLLLATYGHLDRKADAERVFELIENNWRGFDPITIRAVAFWYPFAEPADGDRLAAGLRKANVPD